MISVGYDSKSNRLIIGCFSSFAGELLYALSEFDVGINEQGEKCLLSVDMIHIEGVNKNLAKYKEKITLDESFLLWKKRNKTSRPIIIKAGVTYSKIFGSSDYQIPHSDIEDVCKYFFKPAINQKSYKDKKWDGYIHLYKKGTREFLTGLMDDVRGVLEKKDIPYKVEYIYEQSPPKQFKWTPTNLFNLSEDQKECIEACVKAKRCTIKAATGFGKTSAIARYVASEYGVPTLFIANKKILLDDAAKDFIEGIDELVEDDVAQIKNGIFGNVNLRKVDNFNDDDLWKALDSKKIIVATIQSLSARLEDSRTRGPLLNWLKEKCKFITIDETQVVGSKQWDDVLKYINAPYRLFLSATPKRVDGATIKIFGYSGPIAYDTSASRQIDQGRLCDLDIQYWPFDHKIYNDNDSELNYVECYNDFIVSNEKRNRFIVERTLEMLDEERQVLVLIQFIEHGHILKGMFLENGIELDEIEFVYGDTPDKKRQIIIDNFRKGKFKILIGSTVADAGLNIPSISGVVLCGAGNSDITHIQRIGRGSRTFDYFKNWGFNPKFLVSDGGVKKTKVIDILDTNIAFFKKQSKNRFYNAREEFGVNRVTIMGADQSIFRYRSKKTESLKDIDEKKKLNDMFSAFSEIPSDNKTSEVKNKNSAFNDFLDAISKYK